MAATLAEIHGLQVGQDAFACPGQSAEQAGVARCQAAIARKCDDILYANTPAPQVAWAERALVDIPGTEKLMRWGIVSHSGISDVWCNGAASRVPTDAEIATVVAFLVPYFAAV